MMPVTVGTAVPEWRLASVSAEKMKTFAAILRDPNPIHWDVEEVGAKGLGDRVINQGPTNMGYIMNMLMDWAGPESIKHITMRFTSTVFDGDAVVAGGVVTSVGDDGRLAECDIWLDREDGTRVVSGSATVALT